MTDVVSTLRPNALNVGRQAMRCVLGLILASCCSPLAWTCKAQTNAFSGQTAVGSTASAIAVAVAVQRAGTLSSVAALSQGVAAVDFSVGSGGSCMIGASYALGQSCTVTANFSPRFPGVRSGAIVLQAKDGSSLGTAFLTGTGTGPVNTFLPAEISTVAGHAAWIYSGDGELAINASIYLPFGIAIDAGGNIFIADSGNNRIRKVSALTGDISTVAGNGSLGNTGDGGLALSATLSGPSSVTIDGSGNLYICDSGNNVVRKVTASTGIITTVAGTISAIGYTGDGGLATAATLNSPNGITLDPTGFLYIADTANHAIRKVDLTSGLITTIAGTGVAGYNGDSILAKSARLNAPWSISMDASGDLYIADQGNHRLREVTPNGMIATVAGNGTAGFNGDGGPAAQAVLNAPASSVIDVAGNIYIADSGNNRIRKINVQTGIINTIAGGNTQSISGDGGPATSAGFYGPYTLAMDGTGDLFVADVFHNRIRKLTANLAILNFTAMRIGRVATAQPQTIENDGNAVLNITSLQAVHDAVIDGAMTTCQNGMALAPAAGCIIGGALAPTSLGNPLIGEISLTSDAVNSAGILDLSGQVLSEDPSVVTVAASANPIQQGDTVFFTATVSSSGVMPTGQITLLDSGTSLGTLNLQTNGEATFSISSLAGGQHTITASYSGDNNNTAGVSAPIIEVVNFLTAPTQTALSASANPLLAGNAVTITAVVTSTGTAAGTATLTGPVTFTDGATIIGAGIITNGVTSMSIATLGIGTHSLTASYSGVSGFAASTSAPLALIVQAGSTRTLLSSSANPLPGGAGLTLSALVTSNNIAPTGTVTFLDSTTPLGTAAIGASSTATLQITNPALTVGLHTITAMYSGDANNSSSLSMPVAEDVVLATSTGTVTSSLTPSPQGAPVTLTATITSNGGIPTGAVQFLDGTAILGNATLDITGTATLNAAALALGTHPIAFSYGGDALDASTISATFNEVIVPATTTVSITPTANPSVAGSLLSIAANVQGTGARPVGTVTLQDGITILDVQPIDGSGNANFPNLTLAFGVHNLSALYSGDADHAPNTALLSERIIQATTTTLTSSAPTAIAGTTVTWSVSVSGVAGQPLTGAAQIKDGSAVIATVPLDANGNAMFSSTSLTIGTHGITAVYAGDNLDQSSTSLSIAQVVQIAQSNTTVTSNANPLYTGANLILSATVASNGVTPAGLVTFLDGGVNVGVIRLDMTGNASLNLSSLLPGNHLITASYAGDTNNAPSTSSVLTQSVVQQTVVTVYSSANPSMLSNAVTITVTVSGGLAQYPATGVVSLYDGGNLVGTQTLNAIDTVHFTLSALTLGQHLLTASYTGDTTNSAASSPVFTQTVTLTPTVSSFTSSATTLSSGQSVTFIALVQGAGPNIPTGTVTFMSGSTVLGMAALDPTGLATLNITPSQGTDTVVVQYPGDSLFASSTSTPSIITVGATVAYTMNITPAKVAMASGDHTTLQINITSANTYADTLDLACAGLPAYATCTFSNSSIAIAGGASVSLSVVVDTGTPLGAGPTASLAVPSPVYCAWIVPGSALFGMLLLRRRRAGKLLATALALLLLATGTCLTGCGNSLSVEKTRPGTYTFQIIARGLTSNTTQSGVVSLTVTQ